MKLAHELAIFQPLQAVLN